MSTDSFNTNYFIALFSGGLHWSAGRSWRRCHSLSKLIDLLLDLWQRQALSSNIPTTSAHDPNRYPPNGVWGNQRVFGGARKVLEEGGWSFPGLAQAPGSKHFNPLFYFLKKNTPLPNEDPSWMTPSTRQRTSPRRIWDAVGQNCTLTFSGLRGLFVNLILIDQGSIDFPYLADFQ